MSQIYYEPEGTNDFHNQGGITIRPHMDQDSRQWISRRQYDRITRHFCGVADCHCPAGGLYIRLETRDVDPWTGRERSYWIVEDRG